MEHREKAAQVAVASIYDFAAAVIDDGGAHEACMAAVAAVRLAAALAGVVAPGAVDAPALAAEVRERTATALRRRRRGGRRTSGGSCPGACSLVGGDVDRGGRRG